MSTNRHIPHNLLRHITHLSYGKKLVKKTKQKQYKVDKLTLLLMLELQVDTNKRCLYSGRIGLQFQSTKQLNYEIISRLFSKSISFLIKFSFRLLLNGRQLCRTLVESLIISLNPNAKIGSISVTI